MWWLIATRETHRYPQIKQYETLQKIHEGHQGILRCRMRAEAAVWWPGMHQELANFVKQCKICAKEQSPRWKPLITTDLPLYPWQIVATDLFIFNGVNYLLVVDYFSRYPVIISLEKILHQQQSYLP